MSWVLVLINWLWRGSKKSIYFFIINFLVLKGGYGGEDWKSWIKGMNREEDFEEGEGGEEKELLEREKSCWRRYRLLIYNIVIM